MQLRKFGLLMGVVCLVAAGYGVRRDATVSAWFFGGMSALWCVAAIVSPSRLAVLHDYWMRLTHLLGAINSRIILSLFFFGILTPIGLLRRCFGWHEAVFRPQHDGSFWRRKEPVDFQRAMRHSF